MKTYIGYYVQHTDWMFPNELFETKKEAREDFLESWDFRDMRDARKSGWKMKKVIIKEASND